jgi:hypothetical protein
MRQQLLKARGALNEADVGQAASTSLAQTYQQRPLDLKGMPIPQRVLELVPESVARENTILPMAYDGETVTCAAASSDDLALIDKLRFLLAKNVRLIPASAESIRAAINHHYGQAEAESVDSRLSEFTDSLCDLTLSDEEDASSDAVAIPRELPAPGGGAFQAGHPGSVRKAKRGSGRGEDTTGPIGRMGMFFYTIEEGQQVLMRHVDGRLEVIAGPRRVWRWGKTFQAMAHYVAHPDQFLVIRYRNGQQEHLAGPAHIWLDPRVHLQVRTEDALQLSAKEAVVVYSKTDAAITRRVVHGPALFVPQPGEWLHTFSWHASRGGSRGAQKVPNGLVFQKLWLMPDQMYHDVLDVRTADDAVLTIRLMIFFELIDIDRMLDTTHDPIGDFVNAATSDVVEFAGKHTFESFKCGTEHLNDLETYRQLTGRAAQCGYRINKVVYRGYGTADALQQMHDHAIEARTKLQLERATEQQAQELENYKLDSQLGRAGKRRHEQTAEVAHDLELADEKYGAALRQQEAKGGQLRERRRQDAELELDLRRRQDEQQREHLRVLKEMGVDLTAYLTQSRADRVIELRGGSAPHIHLEPTSGNGPAQRGS